MQTLAEIIGVVAEVFCIHIYLHSILKLRSYSSPTALASALGYCIFGLCDASVSIFLHSPFINISCSLLGIFLLAYILHQSQVFISIFASVSFVAIVSLLDMLIMGISSFCGLRNQDLLAPTTARLFFIILEHFLLLGLVSIVSALSSMPDSIVSKKTVISLFPCWAASILLCCIWCYEITANNRSLSLAYFVVTCGLLYTNVASIYLIKEASLHETAVHQKELSDHHYAMENEYYEQFHKQQEEMRALWHDIDKYLLAMQAVSNHETNHDGSEILNTISDVLQSSANIVDVNNTDVSIILNRYIKIANIDGIDLRLDVQIPPVLFTSVPDLYILLGNTLDNAIEACRNLPVELRNIDLILKVQNDILFYNIKNPYSTDSTIQKTNRFHGYGLKNVQKCVEKYNGAIVIDRSDHIFSLSAHLNRINTEI